jgi:Fe2+ or Zn2+ uptake regulation protein
MAWRADVYLICDKCGEDMTVEVEKIDQSPEDIIDAEGWMLTDTLLDKLLCTDCAEEEE